VRIDVRHKGQASVRECSVHRQRGAGAVRRRLRHMEGVGRCAKADQLRQGRHPPPFRTLLRLQQQHACMHCASVAPCGHNALHACILQHAPGAETPALQRVPCSTTSALRWGETRRAGERLAMRRRRVYAQKRAQTSAHVHEQAHEREGECGNCTCTFSDDKAVAMAVKGSRRTLWGVVIACAQRTHARETSDCHRVQARLAAACTSAAPCACTSCTVNKHCRAERVIALPCRVRNRGVARVHSASAASVTRAVAGWRGRNACSVEPAGICLLRKGS
jgi:hypothetical protein